MRRDEPRTKVLVVGPTPPPFNGMSVAMANILASSLKEQFHLVHLDTADRRGLANIGRLDLTNIFLALRHFLQFLWLLLTERPKAVYLPIAQNTPGFLRDCLFLLPAELSRRKVIIHLHGSYFQEYYRKANPLVAALVRWTMKRVCRAIVLDEDLKFAFRGLVSDERIVVVPNGLDRKALHAARWQERDPAAEGRAGRVLYLSTMVKSKGFLDLLRAVPLVLAQRPEAKFTFAGELCNEQDGQEAREFIIRHSLQPKVDFVGEVSGQTKAGLLASSDLFVFPPRAPEGQPFVILEAMAAGLPIITTDRGCIKKTVEEGGLLAEEGNPPALAKKILELLADETLRVKMGKANQEKFLREYTLEAFAQKLGETFQLHE